MIRGEQIERERGGEGEGGQKADGKRERHLLLCHAFLLLVTIEILQDLEGCAQRIVHSVGVDLDGGVQGATRCVKIEVAVVLGLPAAFVITSVVAVGAITHTAYCIRTRSL